MEPTYLFSLALAMGVFISKHLSSYGKGLLLDPTRQHVWIHSQLFSWNKMSPPDPTKNVEILKEQVRSEFKAFQNFPKKWLPLTQKENFQFYDPEVIDEHLKEVAAKDGTWKFDHNSEGEGFFVSPQMYEKLLQRCRCGREKQNAHVLHCLQREKGKFPRDSRRPRDDIIEEIHKRNQIINGTEYKPEKLPDTSNGFFGWTVHRNYYQKWDHSTKYISPRYNMPGPKIASEPYSILFIG